MPTDTLTTTARIIDVFSSIQGEGLYVGQPHLFVRFWDCNMTCHYCDTEYRGPFQEMSLGQLEAKVSQLLVERGPHEAVSLTGGEPLLWWQFLTGFLPWLKSAGQRTYLETNGTLSQSLEAVLPWVDVIAMDLKPPSATADRPVWREHAAFLEAAMRPATPPELFVKIVVTPETTDDDLDRAVGLLASVDRRIPLVLQPVTPPPVLPPAGASSGRPEGPKTGGGVTPYGLVVRGPQPGLLTRWLQRARLRLDDVRVIPQIHPILGVP